MKLVLKYRTAITDKASITIRLIEGAELIDSVLDVAYLTLLGIFTFPHVYALGSTGIP